MYVVTLFIYDPTAATGLHTTWQAMMWTRRLCISGILRGVSTTLLRCGIAGVLSIGRTRGVQFLCVTNCCSWWKMWTKPTWCLLYYIHILWPSPNFSLGIWKFRACRHSTKKLELGAMRTPLLPSMHARVYMCVVYTHLGVQIHTPKVCVCGVCTLVCAGTYT